MSIIVRPAVPSDLDEIVGMQQTQREDMKIMPTFIFQKDLAEISMLSHINSVGSVIIIAEDKHTQSIMGMFWLEVVRPHYCREYYLSDVFLFIKQAYRNSRCMYVLLTEAIHIATLLGCEHLDVSCVTGETKLDKLYSKRYPREGYVYRIGVK